VALARVVSKIFNVEKCRDLEILVKGHSRSLKVVPCDRLGMVSYVSYIKVLYFQARPEGQAWWTI